jgi:hypothetical protein
MTATPPTWQASIEGKDILLVPQFGELYICAILTGGYFLRLSCSGDLKTKVTVTVVGGGRIPCHSVWMGDRHKRQCGKGKGV